MENREAAQYIENINIKGLWGRYDVNWQLHADVNILVGENGTGKSTILEAVKNSFELTERLAKDLKMSDYFNVASSEITVVFIVLLFCYLLFLHRLFFAFLPYGERTYGPTLPQVNRRFRKNVFFSLKTRQDLFVGVL